MHVVESFQEAKEYAQQHFPQVIQYVAENLQKKEESRAVEHINVDVKNWKFFDDDTKKTIHIDNILKYAILSQASDVHL